MCAPALRNWTSKYKSLTKEDLYEELRSDGKVVLHLSNDRVVQPSNSMYATHYGIMTAIDKVDDVHADTIETLPCDATTIVLDSGSKVDNFLKLLNFEKSYHDSNEVFEHDIDFINPISEEEPVKEKWTPTTLNTGYKGLSTYISYEKWKARVKAEYHRNYDKVVIIDKCTRLYHDNDVIDTVYGSY